MIRLVDAPRWVERWFHWKFAECRLVGEWFTFRPDMLSLDPPKERPAFVIPRRGDGRTRLVAVRLSDIEMDLLRSIAGRESRSLGRMAAIAMLQGLATFQPDKRSDKAS